MTIKVEPVAVSVKDAIALTSLSRNSIYNLIQRGELESRMIYGRRVIPMSAIRALVG